MRDASMVVPMIALIAGAAVSACLYRAGGPSVDLFVTVVLAIAVLAPLSATWTRSHIWSLVNSTALVVGLTAGWFWLALRGNILWSDAFHAGLVELSIGLAGSGTARLLSGGSGDARLVPGVVSIVSVAWATWPVWLSSRLSGQSLIKSVAIQPLFAVNSAVLDLGNWVDQPMGYQLTNFGQDVLYKMPGSVWAAVAFHGSIAIVTWTLTLWLDRDQTLSDPPTA